MPSHRIDQSSEGSVDLLPFQDFRRYIHEGLVRYLG